MFLFLSHAVNLATVVELQLITSGHHFEENLPKSSALFLQCEDPRGLTGLRGS